MNEIIEKINSGIVINQADVLKIASITMTWNDLDKYVKDIIFNDESYYPGSYNHKTGIIAFNDEKIIKNGYRLYDLLYTTYQIDENYFSHILNFFYIYVINHELGHAYQKKKYLEGDDELFDFLYKIREKYLVKKKFYDDHHDLFPTEREAINIGNLNAYHIMCQTNLPKREKDILYLYYLIRRIRDYDKTKNRGVISPTHQLFELLEEDSKPFSDLYGRVRLSLDERVNLGLYLNSDEYKKLYNANKTKHLIYKKNNRI